MQFTSVLDRDVDVNYPQEQLTLAPAAARTLMSGSRWNNPAPDGRMVITYSFANASSTYAQDPAGFAASLSEFSTADKALTRALLDRAAAVCNIRFVEVPDAGEAHGDVRYAYTQQLDAWGYAGYGYFPSTPDNAGHVWLATTQAAAQWDNYRPSLILHETFHALGLKHPFSGNVVLDVQSDVITHTVMSYSPIAGSQNGSLSIYPSGPMLLDIAALQAIYGTASHDSGDTVYDLSGPEFQSGFRTLWDSGGADTLDASHVAHGVRLDLREGGHSDVGLQVHASAYFGAGATRTLSTTVYTETVTIAYGTTIERAFGTAWDDVILVSPATARADGGAGTDAVVFTGTVDDYRFDAAPGAYSVTRLTDGSTTTVTGFERIEFSNLELQPASLVVDSQDASFAQAFRLYKAALDRLPDQEGLIYQTRALQSGLSLPQLAGNFMASSEFQQRFGATNNTEFVTLLYDNVLDRAPDSQGLAYHLERLDSGAAMRADVLVGFSESPENKANVAALLTGIGAAGMLVPV